MASLFRPEMLCVPGPQTPSNLLRFNKDLQVMNPQFVLPESNLPRTRHTDWQTIVVFAGAYTSYASPKCLNASPKYLNAPPTSGVALYFGRRSTHNRAAPVPIFRSVDPGLTRDEYHAAAQVWAIAGALTAGRALANAFGKDRVAILKVVVATTAKNVQSMFTGAGAVGPKGKRVQPTEPVRLVQKIVRDMFVKEGILIEFWEMEEGECEEVSAARAAAKVGVVSEWKHL